MTRLSHKTTISCSWHQIHLKGYRTENAACWQGTCSLSGLGSNPQNHWCLFVLSPSDRLAAKKRLSFCGCRFCPGLEAPCPTATRIPCWNIYKGLAKFKESVYSQGMPKLWNQVFIIPPSPDKIY